MFESKTITMAKDMSLTERISEVAKQVSGWLSSLGSLSDVDRNSLRLTKCQWTSKGYRYDYSISIGEELSASDTKVQNRLSAKPDTPKDEPVPVPAPQLKFITGLYYFQALHRK